MNGRIKKIVDYSQMSITVFADTIGISRSALVHLLSGRNQPSLDVLRKILNVFPEISIDWIMFGIEPMFRDNRQQHEEQSQTDSDSVFRNQTNLFGELLDSEADITEMQSKQVSPIVHKKVIVPQNNNYLTSNSRKEKTKIQSDKKLIRIVFFYNDNSFEEFRN